MTLKTTQYLPHSAPVTTQPDWGWVHTFTLLQFTFQILLLFPQFGVLRLPMRVATFALSLVLLVRLRGDGPRHPATSPAIWVLLIMVASFCLHSSLNSVLAGAAQCAMYAAILGPLFWVKSLKITPKGFQWLIFMMWGFHTVSAIFGALQVYFPGQFQPYLSTAIQDSQWGGDHLKITLANGAKVYRPMGLTDRPGGAAMAGFYALLLGVGIAVRERKPVLRLACMGSAMVGLFCIYLSQVRSILVFSGICLVCLAVVLLRQGNFGRLTIMTVGIAALVLATFAWAVTIGGESTLARLSSLVSDRADAVYQQNRGHFLEYTINVLLPQYPLGAGLGRWGMMNSYFGDKSNPLTQGIWVEIQWTGWLLDGGVPLIIAYVVALAQACRTAWKIAISPQVGDFKLWGGLIFAYNIGAIAITFNYPLFIGQGGMEFWLLNSALFVAAYHSWMERIETVRRLQKSTASGTKP
jgi:hypothetical protein